MTTVLIASASVHTTAAACDHLGDRLDAEDTVVVLGVAEPGLSIRDVGDAANVARTRLVAPSIETVTLEGTPADAVASVADEHGVDEVIVGATRGDPEAAGDPPGSTVLALLSGDRWPVVVLPSPAP